MLSVPVFNMKGERTGEMTIDPAVLGGRVRPALIKQAVVAYLDHQRQRSVRTKRRSDVVGSTHKLYRQKGTGRARMGASRTPLRRGGGRAFGRRVPGAVKGLPKGMRRLARNSAVLAKIRANDVAVVEDLRCDVPRTKPIASMLQVLGADRGCVLALHGYDANVYRSGRNIPRTDVRVVDELTPYEILRRRKLLFTRAAFELFGGGRPAASAAGGETRGGDADMPNAANAGGDEADMPNAADAGGGEADMPHAADAGGGEAE